MLFALQDEHGDYIHKNSTLSGGYTYVHYTPEIKFARLWEENDKFLRGTQTRINNLEVKQKKIDVSKPITFGYAGGFRGVDDGGFHRLITAVNIVELELTKKAVKDNG